ncbi:MAG: iron ABC transporter permease [Thiotrichales bacterium]|nr:iron ABC transporter permease [Thiotrichales bacterium]
MHAPTWQLLRRNSSHSLQGLTLWDGLLLGLVLIFSIPLLTVFSSVFEVDGEVWRHLRSTVLTDYVVNSLLLMLGVGLLTLLIGVAGAWLVTMYRFPGSRVFEWALLLPMAMPAYIIAYTYTGVLDVGGPVQIWIREFLQLEYGEYWFPDIRSMGGAICMLSLVLYPYVYLLTRAAFIEQSVCALEVSRSLGCSSFQAFYRVGIALARPAIIVGLSLVLMETLADYGTVQYFGVATFTTGIFRTWFGLGDSLAAAQLSAFMLCFVMLLLLLEYRSRQRSRFHHTSTRYQRISKPALQGIQRWAAWLACALPVLLGFVFPVLFIVYWALQTYATVIDDEFVRLAINSLALASLTALIAIVLSLCMAYGNRRTRQAVIQFGLRFVAMGYAIPGTVIAVGVLLPFAWLDHGLNTWATHFFGINTGLLFSGTLVALVFAYLVRFLAVSLNTLNAALMKVKPSMDEAARSMGLNDSGIIRRIHVPMIRGSMLTAALLVFVDVLKELPATLILRPFNFNTLAVRTYELANEERLADAACPALAIVLVSIIPVILLSRSISRSRPGADGLD